MSQNTSHPVGLHPGAAETNKTGAAETNKTGAAETNKTGAAETNRPQRQLPVRKNIRAEFHDYSGGDYFITICTRDKKHYFGKIADGKMYLSALGAFAHKALESLASHYGYVDVPLFVVMPNHIHAIIQIRDRADAPGCIHTERTALGVVVGGYKQSVTRYARRNSIDFGWQPRYHDHIIRSAADGNHIAGYIETNVARWAQDCFYQH